MAEPPPKFRDPLRRVSSFLANHGPPQQGNRFTRTVMRRRSLSTGCTLDNERFPDLPPVPP